MNNQPITKNKQTYNITIKQIRKLIKTAIKWQNNRTNKKVNQTTIKQTRKLIKQQSNKQ